jgi:hypothetical protein
MNAFVHAHGKVFFGDLKEHHSKGIQGCIDLYQWSCFLKIPREQCFERSLSRKSFAIIQYYINSSLLVVLLLQPRCGEELALGYR